MATSHVPPDLASHPILPDTLLAPSDAPPRAESPDAPRLPPWAAPRRVPLATHRSPSDDRLSFDVRDDDVDALRAHLRSTVLSDDDGSADGAALARAGAWAAVTPGRCSMTATRGFFPSCLNIPELHEAAASLEPLSSGDVAAVRHSLSAEPPGRHSAPGAPEASRVAALPAAGGTSGAGDVALSRASADCVRRRGCAAAAAAAAPMPPRSALPAASALFAPAAAAAVAADTAHAPTGSGQSAGLSSLTSSCELPGGWRRSASAEEDWKSTHPCILANFEQFQRTVRHKRVVVFLDYDGTLTPIVSNPDEAFMSPAMRATVRSLAELFPTAIISGRGRSKVEGFVQLPELFYAGSHGLDIKGPVVKTEGGEAEVLPLNLAGDLLTTMAAVRDEARAAVRAIAGAHVEDNKFSVSVHFRNCSPADWDEVRCSVEAIAARWRDVHVTRGRKVLELRPQVAWDKGRALLHLLEALALHEEPDVLPIYIGDDRTDEDAFGVLRGRGVGVLVSSIPKVTAAAYTLRDPEQVGRFLVQLAEWGANSPDNGWLREPSCVGWACRANSSDSGGSVTSAQGL